MSEHQILSIGDVAGQTGLSARALRYYEERGLIDPVRAANGQRAYREHDLLRLHQIVLLKRADFSLRQIKGLLDAHTFDATEIIDAQISLLEEDRGSLDAALESLRSARASIDADGHLDVDALCAMIQYGENEMSDETWQKVIGKFYTPEELKIWKQAEGKLDVGFDQEAYSRKWVDIGARIEAALPLDPVSAAAQAFLGEWQALLAPFLAVADDTMKAGTANLWNNMDSWPEGVQSPFSQEVWDFIKEATKTADAS